MPDVPPGGAGGGRRAPRHRRASRRRPFDLSNKSTRPRSTDLPRTTRPLSFTALGTRPPAGRPTSQPKSIVLCVDGRSTSPYANKKSYKTSGVPAHRPGDPREVDGWPEWKRGKNCEALIAKCKQRYRGKGIEVVGGNARSSDKGYEGEALCAALAKGRNDVVIFSSDLKDLLLTYLVQATIINPYYMNDEAIGDTVRFESLLVVAAESATRATRLSMEELAVVHFLVVGYNDHHAPNAQRRNRSGFDGGEPRRVASEVGSMRGLIEALEAAPLDRFLVKWTKSTAAEAAKDAATEAAKLERAAAKLERAAGAGGGRNSAAAAEAAREAADRARAVADRARAATQGGGRARARQIAQDQLTEMEEGQDAALDGAGLTQQEVKTMLDSATLPFADLVDQPEARALKVKRWLVCLQLEDNARAYRVIRGIFDAEAERARSGSGSGSASASGGRSGSAANGGLRSPGPQRRSGSAADGGLRSPEPSAALTTETPSPAGPQRGPGGGGKARRMESLAEPTVCPECLEPTELDENNECTRCAGM